MDSGKFMRYDFPNDPILWPAFEYWRGKCGPRAMPRRCDIDPTEIPRLLRNIQITEIIGARTRFRLVGTAIVEAYGSELTGKFFDEVFSGERLRFAETNYRLICTEKRPIFVSNNYCSKKDLHLVCNRVVMPLSDDGVNVNQCISAMSFQFPPGERYEWADHWSGTSSDLDVAQSDRKIIR